MSDIDNSLEQLLRQAPPRTVPDAAGAAAARAAVRSEWQAVTGKHRSRKRLLQFAVAATVLISVFTVFIGFRGPDPGDIQVASIERNFGSIYFLGQQSELTPATDLASIRAGQTIVTGGDAGIALAWQRGGSVRLDKNTKVEFIDDNTVHLHEGQVYYDSGQAAPAIAGSVAGLSAFVIRTDHGTILHLGTQFMARVAADELVVSVREGQVNITGRFHQHTAAPGEQATFRGRERPQILSIPGYGNAWDWIGRSTPALDIDGKSTYDFLQWVGRELGRDIIFSNHAVEQDAKRTLLRDDIDASPAEALRLRMATSGIEWRYDGGSIYVGKNE